MTIELNKDQSLVLFEFLSRFSDSDELTIEHEAEERALWILLGEFESVLVEPFEPNYKDLLEQARDRMVPE